MKKVQIAKLILESVREVVKEDNVNLDEIDFGGMFKYTPPTDEQIDAYLRSRPKDKAVLDKDPERKAKFIDFVKTDKAAGKSLKAKEVVFATYDPKTKEYKGAAGTKSMSGTSFGEAKESTSKKIFVVLGPEGEVYGAKSDKGAAEILKKEKDKDLAMSGSTREAFIRPVNLD